MRKIAYVLALSFMACNAPKQTSHVLAVTDASGAIGFPKPTRLLLPKTIKASGEDGITGIATLTVDGTPYVYKAENLVYTGEEKELVGKHVELKVESENIVRVHATLKHD